MCFTIRQPQTEEEFEQYYQLRWLILRAPWQQPNGSEKDSIEENCIHFISLQQQKNQQKEVIGVARLQFNTIDEAQIRYMAVNPLYERKGIGRQLMASMEQRAAESGYKKIKLDAREMAIGFYQLCGYKITKKSYLLFDEIQHYTMEKIL